MLNATLALTGATLPAPPPPFETTVEPPGEAEFNKEAALAAPLFRSEVGTDVPHLCRRADQLCRAISPLDLPPDRPIYVVAQSMLEGHMREPAASGWTWPWLHELLRPHVPYWGAGPAIIVNDLALQRDFRQVMAERLFEEALTFRWPAGAFERIKALWVESNFFGTVVHELAHALPFSDSPPPELSAGHERSFDDLEFVEPPEAGGVSADADRHDPTFTRLAIHFRERALRYLPQVQCFADIPIEFCGAGPMYGLAPVQVYEACLENEPERLLGRSASEILAAELPRPFFWLYGFELSR